MMYLLDKWIQSDSENPKMAELKDLIGKLCSEAEKDAKDSVFQRKQKQVGHAILKGVYGEQPKKFFQRNTPEILNVQKIILRYLVMRQEYHRKCNDFENVLNAIFQNEIYFYFDEVKHILFIALLPEETPERMEIISVCQFLFADILMPVKIKWNCYPVILNRTRYAVAGEGEQLCGTII